METLWKSESFTTDDFRVFKYPAENGAPKFTTFHTDTTLRKKDPDNSLVKATKTNTDDLNEWIQNINQKSTTGDCFALLLLHPPLPKRQSRFPQIVNPASLKYLPIPQKPFQSVVEKLCIHHAFAVILERGVPIISRARQEIKGRNCYIYTLRVEHTLKYQSAMTITHFAEAINLQPLSNPPGNRIVNRTPPQPQPSKSETYALILGYEDVDTTTLHKTLKNSEESIFSPFTLIKAFLMIERGHRFTEVNRKIMNFQNILQNYGRLPFGSDGSGIPEGDGEGTEEDPKNLIGLYLDIYTLKIRLMAWSAQIDGLKKHVDDFAHPTGGRQDIDPEEYLQRMVNEYEVKINKCEMVLQGASLAFQMETAHLARLDSARSMKIAEYARADSVRSIQIAELSRLDSLNVMRDGKQMKAIALLTMVFLPGTFIATVLAVPVFESIKNTTRFNPGYWYPILFVPLTIFVLAVYLLWITYYKSESQKEVDNLNSPQLQGKLHAAIFNSKPNWPGCHEIKSEALGERLSYNFVNYSAADLGSDININTEVENHDLRAFRCEWRSELDMDEEGSPTTVSTSSSREIARCSTPASSIDDMDTHRPNSTYMFVDITNEIDPQLLSHPIPDKEGAHPLKHRSSVEDIDLGQGATILAINAKNAETLSTITDTFSVMKLAKPLPLVLNSAGKDSNQRGPNFLDGNPVSPTGSSIDGESRDVQIILDDNESNEPDSNRHCGDCYSEHSRGISASGLQIISSSLSIAEATEGDHLPASVQTTQQLEPPTTLPEDDQYIVERLLRKKVISRGRGRRRRVTQYFVKWQGYPDEENTWVNEDDIHEDLITAYNNN